MKQIISNSLATFIPDWLPGAEMVTVQMTMFSGVTGKVSVSLAAVESNFAKKQICKDC